MGANILVVEDTPYSLQLMTYLLTAHEHTVTEAVTGEQAIELAYASPPDLVVMDLQLPGIDGCETLTAVRSIPDRDAVPVIAVTSFAMVGDRDRALEAGFDQYVTKPIDPESFVEEISNWLPKGLRGTDRPQPRAESASATEPMHEPVELAEDRDRCFAAGMDDYLSKPIDPDRLNAALERWITDVHHA